MKLLLSYVVVFVGVTGKVATEKAA